MQFTKYLLIVFVFLVQIFWVFLIAHAIWKANPILKSNEAGAQWKSRFEITGGVLGRTVLDSPQKSLSPKPTQHANYSIAYFQEEIMPILRSTKGRETCMTCHQLGGDVKTPMELYINPKDKSELQHNYKKIIKRINEPNKSKILLMPLGGQELGVKHPGGRLLTEEHPDFRKLRSWVMGEHSTKQNVNLSKRQSSFMPK